MAISGGAWLLIILFVSAASARIRAINDLGLPTEGHHIPVSPNEPHRFKHNFVRVHPEMGNTTYTYDTMIKSHVIVMTPAKGVLALKCSPNSLAISFAVGAPVHTYTVGSILVGGPEYQCTDKDGHLTAAYHEILDIIGYFNSTTLRGYRSVLRVRTREVLLTDLFHYVRVLVRHEPAHPKTTNEALNVTLERDKRFGFTAGVQFQIGKEQPMYIENSNIRLSCDKCFFKFQAGFEFVLDFSNWWIIPSAVDRFKILFTGNAMLNMDVSVSLLKKASFPIKSVSLAQKDLNPISFAIGPIPVVIIPELEISLGLNLEVEASLALTFGFDVGVKASLGAEYTTAKGFKTITDFGLPANFHKPTLVAGGKVYTRAYLKPAITAKIYGLFPVAVSVQPYAELILESLSSGGPCGSFAPALRLDAGLQGIIEVEPIDFKLFTTTLGGILPAQVTINLYGPETIFSACPFGTTKALTKSSVANVPRYIVRKDPWSPCNAKCGPGKQTRAVYCFDLDTQSKTDDSNCPSSGSAPATTQDCELRECRRCGVKTCGECLEESDCSWCVAHGGVCMESDNTYDCPKLDYLVKPPQTCPKPLSLSGDLVFSVGQRTEIKFTGGIAAEPMVLGFTYNNVTWYHGGIVPHRATITATSEEPSASAGPHHSSATTYKGCLPAGKITVGVFSQLTQFTALTSGEITGSADGAGCVLYSPFGACTVVCGNKGTQTRDYTCYNGGVEGCQNGQTGGGPEDPLQISCRNTKECKDKPVKVLRPSSIVLQANKQKLFVSWVGGTAYDYVSVSYRYMTNLYKQEWQEWAQIDLFKNGPGFGNTSINMAKGYPTHTYYQVRVCSSINKKNCDISTSFSVTKPTKYKLQFVRVDSSSDSTSPTEPPTTQPPATEPPTSESSTSDEDQSHPPPATTYNPPSSTEPRSQKRRAALAQRSQTTDNVVTSFTANVTLSGVASKYSSVSKVLSISLADDGAVDTEEIEGYDIGFIYTLQVQLETPSSGSTPTFIVTAASATQSVTFGVNVPISSDDPIVQRYSCEGTDQTPCTTFEAAAGCGWCVGRSICVAGNQEQGYSTSGEVLCEGDDYVPNNSSYYLFTDIDQAPSSEDQTTQQNKRDAKTCGSSDKSSTSTESDPGYTASGSTCTVSRDPETTAALSSDSSHTLDSSLNVTTNSESDQSNTDSPDSSTYSTSQEWPSVKSDETSLYTSTSYSPSSTPTTTSDFVTESEADTSFSSEDTYTEETSDSLDNESGPTPAPLQSS